MACGKPLGHQLLGVARPSPLTQARAVEALPGAGGPGGDAELIGSGRPLTEMMGAVW